MKTVDSKSYDKWKAAKIRAIAKEIQCNYAEAVMIFYLQDISYKLSHYYYDSRKKK